MSKTDPRLLEGVVPAETVKSSGCPVEKQVAVPAEVDAWEAAYGILWQARVNAARADDIDAWYELDKITERLRKLIATKRSQAATGGNDKHSGPATGSATNTQND